MNLKNIIIGLLKKYNLFGHTNKQAYFNIEEGEEIRREKIEGTPFFIMWVKERGGYYIQMGDYRLTEIKDNWEELLEMIETKNWQLQYAVTCAVHEHAKKMEKEAEEAVEKVIEEVNENN